MLSILQKKKYSAEFRLASLFVLFFSMPISALPMNDNSFDVESSLQANRGWINNEGSMIAQTTLAGLKLKMKHRGKVAIGFDGYTQHTRLEANNSDQNVSTEYTLNQLFLSYRVGANIKLSAGRQRVLWGHGLSFVPTDFVNPPLDPSRLDLTNAKGVDAISIDYFSRNNSLTFLANVSDTMERSGAGLKWTNNTLDGLDFNFVYYNSQATDNAIGTSVSTDPVSWFSEDSRGELNAIFSIGVKEKSEYKPIITTNENYLGESIECDHFGDSVKEGGTFTSAMAGLTYEWIDSRMTFRADTYYVEEGFKRGELNRFYRSVQNECAIVTDIINDFSTLVPGRVQTRYSTFSIGQDPLTEGTGNRFTDNLSYSIGYTRGHEDGSALTTIAVRSRFFSSAELALDIFLPNGHEHTEFGTMPMDRQFTLGVIFPF